MNCPRCQGCLVPERFEDHGGTLLAINGYRCLQCGCRGDWTGQFGELRLPPQVWHTKGRRQWRT